MAKLSRATGASIAEFGPVLLIFVLIIIVPLINLFFVATGYACVASVSQSCATDAANSPTFNEALVNIQKRARSVVDSGLGKFVKLQPVGGYQGCGVDLFVATTSVANTNNGQFYGPNTGLPAGTAADTSKNIYQYTLRTSFTVGPCMDLSRLPLLGDLPLVGKAARVDSSVSRAVEHADGLTAESTCEPTVRH